jgi:DNA ligase-1
MFKHVTLYKRTSTGAIQIWYMESEDNTYRTVSGQIDGKHVTSELTTVFGKNIGKVNETSDEDQCQKEVEAKYIKQLAQGGYYKSIDEIDNSGFFEPMLAEDYKKKFKPSMLIDGVYSQPKYDGMRCIASKNGLFSRQGKPIPSAPHIMEVLSILFSESPNMILDGELYNHSLKDNFNELMSLAKQSKPTPEDLKKSAKWLKYYVYDIYAPASFGQRNNILTDMFHEDTLLNQDVIVQVPTKKVNNQDSLDKLYASYLEEGYEGQMVRLNGPYENKRTKYLLKRKEFQDAEYEIVSIEEGSGNRAGMAGTICYKMDNGKTFRSGIKGGVEFYKEIWSEKDEYVGGTGTVKFFQLTPDGIPRFPVTIKLYKGERDI